MKYFLDTEFHEYHKQHKVCGINVGKSIPTIDLISIALVSEDDENLKKQNKELQAVKSVRFIKLKEHREYYAICKDFNVKDAWNSHQLDLNENFNPKHEVSTLNPQYIKNYWLRDNVLKPIYDELLNKHLSRHLTIEEFGTFNYRNFKYLLKTFGKSKKQIATEIIDFINPFSFSITGSRKATQKVLEENEIHNIKVVEETQHKRIYAAHPEFFAYYADYDWVVFAQLFGKMNDLPKGFPMYCNDLKQMLDETIIINREVVDYINACEESRLKYPSLMDLKYIFKIYQENTLEDHNDFPKESENPHNALTDAKWGKELFNFLDNLIK